MTTWQLDFYVIYKIGDENYVQSEIGVAVSGLSRGLLIRELKLLKLRRHLIYEKKRT